MPVIVLTESDLFEDADTYVRRAQRRDFAKMVKEVKAIKQKKGRNLSAHNK